MDFLEKDLEEIIYNADRPDLWDRGLEIEGLIKRQLRIGNYGVADLVSFEKSYFMNGVKVMPFLKITVYELKKDKIGISAFLQAVKYCKGIRTYIERNHPGMKISLNISLVGNDVDTSGSFVFLTDLIQHSDFESFPCGEIYRVNFYKYSYKIDGLFFETISDYNLTDTGLKIKPRKMRVQATDNPF